MRNVAGRDLNKSISHCTKKQPNGLNTLGLILASVLSNTNVEERFLGELIEYREVQALKQLDFCSCRIRLKQSILPL